MELRLILDYNYIILKTNMYTKAIRKNIINSIGCIKGTLSSKNKRLTYYRFPQVSISS